MGKSAKRDIFICHASEDKDAIARPLAQELERRGWSVWFDEAELTVGDSLRTQIDEGLAECDFGAVILSPAFFKKKHWTERELDALTSKESATREKVILPIWHEVGYDDVAKYSLALAGRVAVSTAEGVKHVADELEKVLSRSRGGGSASGSAPLSAPGAGGPSATALNAGPSGMGGFEPPAGASTSGFNGIGYLRLFARPLEEVHHPDEPHLKEPLAQATQRAAEVVGSQVDPHLTPVAFDWLSQWQPRSTGWTGGEASGEWEVLRTTKLVAATYNYGGGFSFYTTISLLPEGQQWQCAYEHLWAGETMADLAIAANFFDGVEGVDELRVDLSLTGLDNAVSWEASQGVVNSETAPRVKDTSFESGGNFSVPELAADSRPAARNLLDRFFITFVQEHYDVIGRLKPAA